MTVESQYTVQNLYFRRLLLSHNMSHLHRIWFQRGTPLMGRLHGKSLRYNTTSFLCNEYCSLRLDNKWVSRDSLYLQCIRGTMRVRHWWSYCRMNRHLRLWLSTIHHLGRYALMPQRKYCTSGLIRRTHHNRTIGGKNHPLQIYHKKCSNPQMSTRMDWKRKDLIRWQRTVHPLRAKWSYRIHNHSNWDKMYMPKREGTNWLPHTLDRYK